MPRAEVKATQSRDTIVLVYKKKILNIQKKQKPEQFEEISNLMKANKKTALIEKFLSISEGVKAYSKGNFTVDSEKREVYFKGDKTTPMPTSFVKKLRDHFQKGADYQSLVRFWKKVLLNPNKESREELFDFMLKNNIPLTDEGDIIVEKGVKRKPDGTLVDCHSGTVDNSVGMTVRMPLEKVDNNRRNQCSRGLHVGAPDYVRNHWSSDVVVTCVVSPEHVVSVPQDYNATKMRVCEYRVVGYADKCRINPEDLIYNIEDLFDTDEAVTSMKRKKKRKPLSDGESSYSKNIVTSGVDMTEKGLKTLTAKGIKALIKEKYKTVIDLGDKNKAGIIKKALEIASDQGTGYTVKELSKFSKRDIAGKVLEDYGVRIIDQGRKPKAKLIEEAIAISKKG